MTCAGMAHSCTRNPVYPLLFALLTGCFPSSSMPIAPAGCPNDLGSPIPNFCVVTPNVLWRGAKPAQDGAAWLIQHRVRTIVNLELLHDDLRVFGQVTRRARAVRRLGSAAIDMCWVAAGRMEGFWEASLKPWDTRAAALIVQEAGGRVTGTDGRTWDPYDGHIVATNGRIHDELLAILR